MCSPCVETGRCDGLSSCPLSLPSVLLVLVRSTHIVLRHTPLSAWQTVRQSSMRHCRRSCRIVIIIVVWMTTTNTAVVGRDAIIRHPSCRCHFRWWEKTIRGRNPEFGVRILPPGSKFCSNNDERQEGTRGESQQPQRESLFRLHRQSMTPLLSASRVWHWTCHDGERRVCFFRLFGSTVVRLDRDHHGAATATTRP